MQNYRDNQLPFPVTRNSTRLPHRRQRFMQSMDYGITLALSLSKLISQILAGISPSNFFSLSSQERVECHLLMDHQWPFVKQSKGNFLLRGSAVYSFPMYLAHKPIAQLHMILYARHPFRKCSQQ